MKFFFINTQNLVILFLIFLDQYTKAYVETNRSSFSIIPNYLRINYTKNTGAAFGIASGSTTLLIIISAIICTALFAYIMWRTLNHKKNRLGLWLILAGGIGNLIDRIVRGYVVDFIDVPVIPTFNIADICITLRSYIIYFFRIYFC